MTFQPEHIGLYFGQAQIEQAQQQRESDDTIRMAWQWLMAKPDTVIREMKPKQRGDEPSIIRKPVLSGLDAAVEAALRYRFGEDARAGKQAVAMLESTLQDSATLLQTLMETITAGHIYEMVHPLANDNWRKQFAAYVDALSQSASPTYIERVWLMTLGIVAGIVLDDEARFLQAVADFQHIIDNDIHPEGYIKPLIDEDEKRATFHDMTITTAALCLAAEAATQAGVDLWSYEKREVGVSTLAPYLVYYYFYPEKWHWKETITEADTQALFKHYGAFVEMVAYRKHPRGIELLLEQERPIFGGLVGGLTTLSHGQAQPRKRRWFGF